MVFTIEPGLYFKNEDLAVPEEYRGIGVRIEDDILITADGPVNLVGGPAAQARGRRVLDGGHLPGSGRPDGVVPRPPVTAADLRTVTRSS